MASVGPASDTAVAGLPLSNCKLCLSDRPLVKSHIIPEPFWKLLKSEGETPLLHSTIPGDHAKRAPIGVYDKGILCQSCDGRLGVWDDYGHKTLLRDFDEVCVYEGKRLAGIFDNIDYKKLKLFFLSILWRASVGSQAFFNRVELGEHQNRLYEMIRSEDPGDPDEFAVNLLKLEGGQSRIILSPARTCIENVNYFKLYMGGYVAHIKVDKRPTGKRLREVALQPDGALYVILQDLRESGEFEVMKRIVIISAEKKRKNSLSE